MLLPGDVKAPAQHHEVPSADSSMLGPLTCHKQGGGCSSLLTSRPPAGMMRCCQVQHLHKQTLKDASQRVAYTA